jgi:uncharacterized protein (TIGR03083 family)
MQQPRLDQFLAEIRSSAGTLADIVRTHSPDLPIPTCPDWSLQQLAAHLGRVHRWAAEIVRTRAAQRIPFDAVPDSQYPAERAAQAAWVTAGAERVIAAVTDAGPAEVWAFGRIAPATFWARRQAQETMMHRADAELAAGRGVALDSALAADGIDEWLSLVADPGYGRLSPDAAVLPPGAVLRLHAAGDLDDRGDRDGARDWLVSANADGIAVRDENGPADVTVAGRPGPLLLVLVRRLPPDEENVSVSGDRALLTGWLASTPF